MKIFKKTLALLIVVLNGCFNSKHPVEISLDDVGIIKREFVHFFFFKRGNYFFTYPEASDKTNYFWSGYGDTIAVQCAIKMGQAYDTIPAPKHIADSIRNKTKYIEKFNLLGSKKETIDGIRQTLYRLNDKIVVIDMNHVTNTEWLAYLKQLQKLDESTYYGYW